MEKICIVKRRKERYGGGLGLPTGPRAAGASMPVEALSIRLTPEQAGAIRSNRQFQKLYGGEAHAIIFNLHLPDAFPPRLLDSRKLSEMLGVSRRTVSKLTRAGVLKSYRIGRLRRFSVEDVIEYLSRSVATDETRDDASTCPERWKGRPVPSPHK